MSTYHVKATVQMVVVPTTVNSAGGPCTADPGQVVVEFEDGTGIVFPDHASADALFVPAPEPAAEPEKPKAAKKK